MNEGYHKRECITRGCASAGCPGAAGPRGDAEEHTRPDNVSVRQWRQVVLALRAVPPERRDQFADAVMQLAESYRA